MPGQATSCGQDDSHYSSLKTLPTHPYTPHPSTVIPLNSSPSVSTTEAAYKAHRLEQVIHLQVEHVNCAPIDSRQRPADPIL